MKNVERLKELSYPKKINIPFIYVKAITGILAFSSGITCFGSMFFDVDPVMDTSIDQGIWSMLAVVIVVPIIEEIFFRRMLYAFLEKFLSWETSTIISSFLFAILHGQWYFFAFLVNGWIYSWSKKESRTLTMPIFLHMTYNLIALGTQIM